MTPKHTALFLVLAALLIQRTPSMQAQASEGTGVTRASTADGTRGPINGSPALTGARHPLYRLRKSDAIEIKFAFSPEFDQKVTVLPDGFVALKAAGDLYAEGFTISELRDLVRERYAGVLRDPEVNVVLADFE